MMLYKQLEEDDVIMEIECETKIFDTKINDLNDLITAKMKQYREDLGLMDMIAWLDVYGNEAYKLEKKNNPSVLITKIVRFKDVIYTSQFFDAIQWWKLVGEVKYKELSVLAIMFLGKPMHNGFQERVFSRGTYSDTKLKKRLKEQNFEMSVLNAFNGRNVEEIKERLKQEADWRTDRDNMCVPNKVQAREVIKFFEKLNIDDDVTVVEDETTAKPKDDDTISVGSDIQYLDDDDDVSLEDFLNSKAFLEEREQEENHITSF